ncbi:MAG: hypothetical protein V4463_04980 [Pseudomonadota bacterium]
MSGHSQELRLSGYGTAGLSWDDRRDMAPTRDISQLPRDVSGGRAGYATAPNWRLDSRLGLQLDYRLAPEVELVSQLVLRDHDSATFNNSLESAFAGWRPLPAIDARVGRLPYDAFLMSDTRSLGYAYPWVRPPTEFYGWIPIFSVDGADLSYRFGTEERWRIKAQIGRSGFTVPMGTANYDFKSRDLFTLTLSYQMGPWRAKAGYSHFQVATEAPVLDPLRDGLGQLAQGTASLAPAISAEADDVRRNLMFKDARVGYQTLGLSYDDGSWFGQAEVGRSRSTTGILPHGAMWYAGLGRHWGDWMPYLLASSVRPAADVRGPAQDWSAIGQAGVQALALNVLNSTRMAQDSVALGLRWDVANQASVKLQWTSTHVQASGYGLWWRDLTLNSRPSRVNLLSLNLDFVF